MAGVGGMGQGSRGVAGSNRGPASASALGVTRSWAALVLHAEAARCHVLTLARRDGSRGAREAGANRTECVGVATFAVSSSGRFDVVADLVEAWVVSHMSDRREGGRGVPGAAGSRGRRGARRPPWQEAWRPARVRLDQDDEGLGRGLGEQRVQLGGIVPCGARVVIDEDLDHEEVGKPSAAECGHLSRSCASWPVVRVVALLRGAMAASPGQRHSRAISSFSSRSCPRPPDRGRARSRAAGASRLPAGGRSRSCWRP